MSSLLLNEMRVSYIVQMHIFIHLQDLGQTELNIVCLLIISFGFWGHFNKSLNIDFLSRVRSSLC